MFVIIRIFMIIITITFPLNKVFNFYRKTFCYDVFLSIHLSQEPHDKAERIQPHFVPTAHYEASAFPSVACLRYIINTIES